MKCKKSIWKEKQKWYCLRVQVLINTGENPGNKAATTGFFPTTSGIRYVSLAYQFLSQYHKAVVLNREQLAPQGTIGID